MLEAKLAAEAHPRDRRARYEWRGLRAPRWRRARSGTVSGRSPRWLGPGGPRTWHARKDLGASGLELSDGTAAWATLDGAPLIAARRVGHGVIATLGFHPSHARDADGVVTALLTHLLIWGVRGPVAWLDLAGSLVVRMDRPGRCSERSPSELVLSEARRSDGRVIAADLKKRRCSDVDLPMCLAGWMMATLRTGDARKWAGRMSRRMAGHIHPSPLVRYEDHAAMRRARSMTTRRSFGGSGRYAPQGRAMSRYTGIRTCTPTPLAGRTHRIATEATSWFREAGKRCRDGDRGAVPRPAPTGPRRGRPSRVLQCAPDRAGLPGR